MNLTGVEIDTVIDALVDHHDRIKRDFQEANMLYLEAEAEELQAELVRINALAARLSNELLYTREDVAQRLGLVDEADIPEGVPWAYDSTGRHVITRTNFAAWLEADRKGELQGALWH